VSVRCINMCRLRTLSASAFALLLASCGGDSEREIQVAETTAPETAEMASHLSEGTLGTVTYRYDPAALTRAEVDLALPPDFEKTVFAVKFIPASLASDLGDADCSFGSLSEGQTCSARIEVGFALALLERPLTDYTTALARAVPSMATLEPVVVDEHEGMSFVHDDERTKTRYTFLPAESRTLLLVDRYNEDSDLGAEALEQVRASIDL